MREFSLLGFAGFIAATIAEIDHAKRKALERAAVVIEKEAKRVIGTYDYGWPQLAPSTQAERQREGYAANEPGLRSGAMRDSIEHRVISANEAEIGSDDDDLLWFELGTVRQPPRPVLSGAASHKGAEVAEIIGDSIVRVLIGERVIGSVIKR